MEKQKVIIFGAPKAYNVSDEIKKNLEYLGFKVIDVSFPQEFRYKNKFQKIYNFLRKLILRDRDYKKRLRFEPFLPDFEKTIKALETKADFALFIRPDSFPKSFLKLAIAQSHKSCAYQWDGIELFPEVKSYIRLFDRFFIFDPKDLNIPNVLPATNFYFDYNLNSDYTLDPKVVYFIGSYFKDRMEPIRKIIQSIRAADFTPKINLLTKKPKIAEHYKTCGALFIDSFVSFDQNLENVQKAGVLIDFINGKHNGLSFRTFEAIGHNKKLITNNSDIKKYEFYHPDNFFVWDQHEDFSGLEDFLRRPYRAISHELQQKYSFTNWIHYILDLSPFQPLSLPRD